MARRVLIVEDHPPTRKLLEEVVATMGLATASVANGAEALKLLGASTFDLVITDYIMPHMNGAELIAALRARPEWSGIPVVVLTAVANPDTERSLAAAGVRHVLGKPLDKNRLTASVSAALSGA